MTSRVDRVNRVLLVLLGLLCLAGGIVVLLLSYRAFGTSTARQPLLRPATRGFADRNSGWFWLAVALGTLIVALLALRWLLAQLSVARVGALEVVPTRSGRPVSRPAGCPRPLRRRCRPTTGLTTPPRTSTEPPAGPSCASTSRSCRQPTRGRCGPG